jgi:hypothetical protein
MIRKIPGEKETDMSYTDWMAWDWKIKTCSGSPGVNPGNLLRFNQYHDNSKTILNQTTGQQWSEQCSYSSDVVSGTTCDGRQFTIHRDLSITGPVLCCTITSTGSFKRGGITFEAVGDSKGPHPHDPNGGSSWTAEAGSGSP